MNNIEVYDDIEIYINHISIYGKEDLLIARLRINTAFLHQQKSNLSKTFTVSFNRKQMDPNLMLESDKYKGFQVSIQFTEACCSSQCVSSTNVN